MAEPRRIRTALIACVVGTAAMVGMAYASVPLYRAFCQATGFNGTPRRAEAAAFKPTGRTISVRFDTNVRVLPWTFTADEPTQTVHLGAPGQAFFKVTNNSDTPLTGRAVYSLAPESVGAYFIKTQCFCFDDQTVAAHQTVEFPVIYYIDPKFAADDSTRDTQEVVLSYTFYPVKKKA